MQFSKRFLAVCFWILLQAKRSFVNWKIKKALYVAGSQYSRYYFKIALEITNFCISLVPSPMVQSLASR